MELPTAKGWQKGGIAPRLRDFGRASFVSAAFLLLQTA
jgi:hypothetical protein